MEKHEEAGLFNSFEQLYSLPEDYEPVRPDYFDVQRIHLSKGSLDTEARRNFIERICALYPESEIVRCPDLPHNRIKIGKGDIPEIHRKGKTTLVFGVLGTPVRFSEEEGNTCPNYWHFSTTGFCFYGCKYCYLSGTQGVWYSPTVKIYLNLDEILKKIDTIASRLSQPTAFYLGKLQDGLALDPLTAYSTVLVPFFARHPFARQVLLTKSADVDRLLQLEHGGHTILSWSLNPPEIARRFEENTPSVEERLNAMKRCAEKGYPVRAVLMPLIRTRDWKEQYGEFLREILSHLSLQRLTLGGICSYRNAKKLMDLKLGTGNAISDWIRNDDPSGDGRLRYSPELRIEMYSHLVEIALEIQPDLDVALCLEETRIWESVKLEKNIGRCNCVL